MQSLEAACEDGERSIKRIKTTRTSLPLLRHQESSTSASTSSASLSQEILENPSGKPPIDIFSKLLELHEEFKESEQYSGSTKYNTLLLEKLVARERLNTLIIKLYPGNKGYSYAFRSSPRSSNTDSNSYAEDNTANMIETKLWPYEMGDFLQYIDNEELPPFIVDVLESHFSHFFYNGCVIAEVRDYRQAYPHTKCDIHHVLLRPTLTSILADINNIVKKEKTDWTTEEKYQLESQLVMANAPSLCLDPDQSVYRKLSELNNRKRIWNTHKLQRMAKKCSQVAVNRKRRLDQFTHKRGLELYDFITRSKTKVDEGTNRLQNPGMKVARKFSEEIEPVPVPSLEPPMLSPPIAGVDIKEFKLYQRPKETSDCLPQLIEEYVLETDMPSKDKDKPRVYYIKLSILQRPSTSEYLGELYLDRDYKKDHQNGVACRFSLGSRANALRYIHQFTDIFTESGRKSVRISKYSLNAAAHKEREANAQAQAAAALAAQQQLAQQQLAQQQLAQQQLVQQQLAQQQLAQQQLAQQQLAQQQLAQQHLIAQQQQQHSASATVTVQQQKQVLKTQKSVSPPVVNGTIGGNITVQSHLPTQTNVPILQSHLQGTTRTKDYQQISALATILMNSAEEFEENAKQQQQQQKLSNSTPTTINLLNSSTTSNVNNETNAVVVNATNNAVNQKFFTRKMTISNAAGARFLNHTNLIALNARLQEQAGQQQSQQVQQQLQQLQQQLQQQQPQQQQQAQTITLTSVNSANFTNFTPKRLVTSSGESASNQTALSTLLMGTGAADRPDIVCQSTNTLLVDKLGGGSNAFIQQNTKNHKFMLQQCPKTNAIPLSTPSQNSGVNVTNATVNAQSLNFAQLQSIQGLQVLAQPFSVLNVSSTGNIQGHPNLIMTLPVTTATQTSNSVASSQTAQVVSGGASGTVSVNNIGVTPQAVVLANASTSNLAELLSAQLVSSGVKSVSQQGLRTSTSPQSVSLTTQSGQSLQILTPLPRSRTIQQSPTSPQEQQTLSRTPRNHQRTTPITIKMAAATGASNANTSTSQVNMSTLSSQLQNQTQLQQFQQLCLSQSNVLNKLRRTTNATSTTSDQQ